MVCALEENLAFCEIQDANNSGSVRDSFNFPASSTVAELYQEVGKRIQCHQDSFNLILQGNQNENVVRTTSVVYDFWLGNWLCNYFYWPSPGVSKSL